MAQVLGATPRSCQRRGARTSPQAAWESRAVSHPPAPPANHLEAPPASTEKRTDGSARACGAQPARLPARRRRILRRATGASPGAQPAHLATRNWRVLRRTTGASPGAQTARLATRNRRVLQRATGASGDAQPARLATCTWRVFRRAPSASSGALSARLCGMRSICILNRSVLTLVLLL